MPGLYVWLVCLSIPAMSSKIVLVLPSETNDPNVISLTQPTCPPGHHLQKHGPEAGEKEVCVPCPEGQFTSIPSRARRCKHHRHHCKMLENKIMEGNATMDIVCSCESGRGREYYDNLHMSYFCVTCRNGDVTINVTNGTDPGDTGCCPQGAEATRETRTMKLVCTLPPTPEDLTVSSTTDASMTSPDESTLMNTNATSQTIRPNKRCCKLKSSADASNSKSRGRRNKRKKCTCKKARPTIKKGKTITRHSKGKRRKTTTTPLPRPDDR